MKKALNSCFCIIILSIFIPNPSFAENRGIYIWTQSFYQAGIENTISDLKEKHITDIFLLVKGEAGYSVFPSEYSYKDHFNAPEDSSNKNKGEYDFMCDPGLLNRIIDEAHRNSIRIHAWFILSGDKHFVENNPGSEVVQIQDPQKSMMLQPVFEKGHVNLAYPSYKTYIFSLIQKALEYPFDGLMLDKIRYTSLAYSFDDIHISKALRAGINVNKVIKYAVQSTYGEEGDKDTFLYKYLEGDKDVRNWIEIKKQDILDYVKTAREIAQKKKLILSASFMPEGAYDNAFSDVFYAQNYTELSGFLDYIVIMAYPKAFNQPASWIKMVTGNAKLKSSCPVWTAIQGYDNVTPEFIYDQTISARIAGSDGIAIFRLGGMNNEMWTEFNKAMDQNIEKLVIQENKGIIYSGKGTSRNSWIKSSEALLQTENITPILKEHDLNEYNLFKGMSFILIPGGRASFIADALGVKSLENINSFVKNGGGYIGICAGSYLPIKGYSGNLTEKLEIVNGEAVDIEHWNRGSGPVQLDIRKNHPIFRSIKEKSFALNYFSGPVIKPSDLALPDFKTLPVFRTDYHENGAGEGEMLDKAAVIEANYKKGKIILFSPHPELTEGKQDLLIDAVKYVSNKAD